MVHIQYTKNKWCKKNGDLIGWCAPCEDDWPAHVQFGHNICSMDLIVQVAGDSNFGKELWAILKSSLGVLY